MHLERRGGGYRVRYAIADVGAFVRPGRRDRRRGAPARRDALQPGPAHAAAPAGALRGRRLAAARPGPAGAAVDARPRRGRRADRRRRTPGAGALAGPARLRRGAGSSSTAAGPTSGCSCSPRSASCGWRSRSSAAASACRSPSRRSSRTAARSGSSTASPLPVESWNEQISLMTGMAAADLMLHGEVGVLRTLPKAPDGALAAAAPRGPRARRRLARRHVVRRDGARPRPGEPAARRAARGGDRRCCAAPATRRSTAACPEHATHAAVAAEYAHATAPLRRLVDRYVGEVCLALCAGDEVPGWARAALPRLPAEMADADRRAHELERRVRGADGGRGAARPRGPGVRRRGRRPGRQGRRRHRAAASTRRCGRPATATCRWASRSGCGWSRPTSSRRSVRFARGLSHR